MVKRVKTSAADSSDIKVIGEKQGDPNSDQFYNGLKVIDLNQDPSENRKMREQRVKKEAEKRSERYKNRIMCLV